MQVSEESKRGSKYLIKELMGTHKKVSEMTEEEKAAQRARIVARHAYKIKHQPEMIAARRLRKA